MGDLGEIDLAFVPINLPYTMPPEEAVGCTKIIFPEVVVPYHQGESDPQVVADALAGSGIEVRVLACFEVDLAPACLKPYPCWYGLL